MGIKVGRKRVARLMRMLQVAGISHRPKRRHRPAAAVHDDLVQRKFVAEGPDRSWCIDITEHPTRSGKVYCCAVLDVFSRVVVGWSIADHMRSDLVVDALQMATWRRRPEGTIVHSDRGSQGGFNWSSQHLDDGGVQGWRRATGARRPAMCPRVRVGSGVLTGRFARRCDRLGGLIRRARCSGSSGG
jgi:transposase InsO family protein